MKPEHFYDLIVEPSLHMIERLVKIEYTDEALVMCMTIPGQESAWNARLQGGGPARGYSQFEEGGGVHGVLTHPASSGLIRTICDANDIDKVNDDKIYEQKAWSAFLNMSMTRLLLYTGPRPLPAVGDVQGSYFYYDSIWRPGSKRPDDWPGNYDIAMTCLRGGLVA